MYVGRCEVGGVESQPTFLVSRGFAPANWILTKRQAHWCAKAAKHSANHFQKRTPQIHYLSMYVCRYIFFRNNPRQKHCWIRIRGRGPGASKYEARRAGDEMCLVRRPRALPGGGGFVYSLLACDLSDHGEVVYSPFPVRCPCTRTPGSGILLSEIIR